MNAIKSESERSNSNKNTDDIEIYEPILPPCFTNGLNWTYTVMLRNVSI